MTQQFKLNFDASPVHGEALLPAECQVLDLIRPGRENARQAREISELTGIANVEVRQIIAHLINSHKILIVSATSKPAGYYFPVTEEESDAGAKQLVHRIRALALRLKNIKRETYEKIFGQMNYLDELEEKKAS